MVVLRGLGMTLFFGGYNAYFARYRVATVARAAVVPNTTVVDMVSIILVGA